jgi:hypothetical protein
LDTGCGGLNISLAVRTCDSLLQFLAESVLPIRRGISSAEGRLRQFESTIFEAARPNVHAGKARKTSITIIPKAIYRIFNRQPTEMTLAANFAATAESCLSPQKLKSQFLHDQRNRIRPSEQTKATYIYISIITRFPLVLEA